MIKKIISVAFVAAVLSVGAYSYTQSQQRNIEVNQLLDHVEALSACESVGWWDNDGNCVSNGSVYFCKSDSWHEFTDCKIQK